MSIDERRYELQEVIDQIQERHARELEPWIKQLADLDAIDPRPREIALLNEIGAILNQKRLRS